MQRLPRPTLGLRGRFRHPAQILVAVFAAAIALGTLALLLPVARAGETGPDVLAAAFTATSAVCVTGLVVVDTPTYWSPTGQWIILGLIQVGGFGIMTLASLIGLVIFRRLGLRTRLSAAAETKTVGPGDVRSVVTGVVAVSLAIEVLTALALSLRLAFGYDLAPARAIRLGVFHAVSAFNNAGFALYSDSLTRFVDDPWVCGPVAAAVILGGLGFPVLFEVRRQVRPHGRSPRSRRRRGWSLHTRLTLSTYGLLLAVGIVAVTASEWSNPATIGLLPWSDRVLAGTFHAVMTRTAGFNSVDVGAMEPGTLLITILLMFVGGGTAGTAGGVKVTTVALLYFAVVAEVRGSSRVTVVDRQVDDSVTRQAVTVVLLSIGAVLLATLALLELTPFSLEQVLFEAVSAFATVGLSTGITADLPAAGQLLLVALMFLGRLGPITVVSALALRERRALYELPEGRPLIG